MASFHAQQLAKGIAQPTALGMSEMVGGAKQQQQQQQQQAQAQAQQQAQAQAHQQQQQQQEQQLQTDQEQQQEEQTDQQEQQEEEPPQPQQQASHQSDPVQQLRHHILQQQQQIQQQQEQYWQEQQDGQQATRWASEDDESDEGKGLLDSAWMRNHPSLRKRARSTGKALWQRVFETSALVENNALARKLGAGARLLSLHRIGGAAGKWARVESGYGE
jgi:hypothetical protein